MANIPIRDIPGSVVTDPNPSNLIPMDNGTVMQKTTISAAAQMAIPLASQAEAEAGVNNFNRMSALRVKQSIAAEAGVTIATIAQGALASSAVQPSRTISAGTGLTGGGDLSANRSLALSGTSLASLALADTSIQPGSNRLVPAGGTTGQVLSKASNSDYALTWTSAGAGDMFKSVYDPGNVAGNAFNGYPVAGIAALKAVDPTLFNTIYLTDINRAGQFVWRAGDFTTHVAADPQEGMFVKANSVAVTSGVWMRNEGATIVGLNVKWFGMSSSASAADNATAILACRDLARFLNTWGFVVPNDGAPYELTAGTNLSDNTNLFQGLKVMGIGRPTLKMIGTGEGFKIVNSALSNEYRWHFENFIIEGSATITDAFVVGNCNHSTFKGIETRECTHAGIKTFNTVCNYWEVCAGGNGQYGAQAVTPAYNWLRENDYASAYMQCRGEGAVHNPYTISFAPSAVNITNDTITLTAHRLQTGDMVRFSTTNTLPVGMGAPYVYYLIRVDANTVKIATSWSNSQAGTAVDLTSQGAGTHTLTLATTGVGYINSDWSSDYNGTYEGVHCGANVLDTASSHIGFYGTDFEANLYYDVILLGPEHRLDKIQSISSTLTQVENVLLSSGCTNPLITGGFIRKINNPSDSYAKIIGVALSDNVSLGIQGSGSRHTFGNILRAVGGAITGQVDDQLGRIYAISSGSTSSTNAIRVDSGIGLVLGVRDDGVVRLPGAYTATTAAAANLFVNTDGTLLRSTSALKYKNVVGEITDEMVDTVLSIMGFVYMAKNSEDQNRYIGMAADHFDAAGLKELVHYGPDGEVEGLMYDRIVPILMHEARSVRARLSAIESHLVL